MFVCKLFAGNFSCLNVRILVSLAPSPSRAISTVCIIQDSSDACCDGGDANAPLADGQGSGLSFVLRCDVPQYSDIVCDTCAFHGHGNGLVRRPQEIPSSPAC